MEEAERIKEDDNWFQRIIPTRQNQITGGKYNGALNDKINSCIAQDARPLCKLFS